jgi:protein-S-isoprenylcysteine O-methyltransferase Ste14
MRASDFEFRNRVWFISGFYSAAFFCYAFDHTNVVVAVLKWVAPGLSLESRAAEVIVRAAFCAGAALVIAAAALRTWATAYLQPEVVYGQELRTDGLVADGPYRHVRNPLYLANVFLALGVGIMASRSGFLVLVIGTLVFMNRLIGREEAGLLGSQAERYGAYVAAVPRMWPALMPRLPSGGLAARWARAWTAEALFWIAAFASTALAITLDMRYFAAAAVLGLTACLMAGVWSERKQEPPSQRA